MTASPLILLAGVPATGKSHFGRWLAENQGYIHVDVEQENRLQDLNLVGAWNACFQSNNVGGFVQALRGLGPKVALDWGFPPDHLAAVKEMKRLGLTLWWFDGDRKQARAEFIKRDTVSVSALDVQMRKIEKNWVALCALYGSNRINALSSDGKRLQPLEIWNSISTLSA